jgi:hypothetical protein
MDAECKKRLTEVCLCAQGQQLRRRYQRSLESWAKVREQAWHLEPRGRAQSGEILRLQGEFASSYAALFRHTRECLVCRFSRTLAKQLNATQNGAPAHSAN